jgi:hypothetical protein
MTKQDCLGTSYQPLGGGYAYSALRMGLTIRNPQGRDIYIQPGDDEHIMRDNIAALDDVSLDADCPKRAIIADMLLGEYF